MATLTLGKSVTTDAVRSKKGDAVFVERRRRVVAPGSKELRDEPTAPSAPKNAADEKLRAVLAAAKQREEERERAKQERARNNKIYIFFIFYLFLRFATVFFLISPL